MGPSFAGLVLTAGQHPDLAANMIVERPKVIFNDLTQQFVMWMHIDDARWLYPLCHPDSAPHAASQSLSACHPCRASRL